MNHSSKWRSQLLITSPFHNSFDPSFTCDTQSDWYFFPSWQDKDNWWSKISHFDCKYSPSWPSFFSPLEFGMPVKMSAHSLNHTMSTPVNSLIPIIPFIKPFIPFNQSKFTAQRMTVTVSLRGVVLIDLFKLMNFLLCCWMDCHVCMMHFYYLLFLPTERLRFFPFTQHHIHITFTWMLHVEWQIDHGLHYMIWAANDGETVTNKGCIADFAVSHYTKWQ